MQTPIEQLIERFKERLVKYRNQLNKATDEDEKTKIIGKMISLNASILEAKELLEVELEVIKTAFTNGHESTYIGCESGCGAKYYLEESAEQYYNEQFKND